MKRGDLVEFHTDAWVFASAKGAYTNPGLILRIKEPATAIYGYGTPSGQPSHFIAEVLWADGRITSEHHCYLRPACTITG
jgi:hypothetical protein